MHSDPPSTMHIDPSSKMLSERPSAMHIDRPSGVAGPRAAWTALAFAVALVLVFGMMLDRRINVDENVFIASGALLKAGYLPYRDFHYNHLPTMVFLYAGLFGLTDHLLLAARSCSAAFAAGAVATVFYVAHRAFAALGRRRALALAGGAALMLLCNPLFIYTSQLAWNHAVPTLLTLLAFCAMRGGLAATRRGGAWLALAGALAGLAVTSRLTFAPALLGLLCLGVCFPGLAPRRRAALAGAFVAGFAVAIAPAVWVCAQAPANAYFGNLQYPALNTRYHVEFHDVDERPFTAPEKLVYVLGRLVSLPGNGVVTVLFVVLVARGLRWRAIASDRAACEVFALATIAVALLIGGLVPTPVFRQYTYAATPFMILASVACVARMPAIGRRLGRVLVVCLLVTVGFGVDEYDGLKRLASPGRWVPLEVHRAGVAIAAEIDGGDAGRVLTLDPIYALEGGERIYPELATARFGVRVAAYMTDAQQAQRVMFDLDDVRRMFASDRRPAALLTSGADPRTEASFVGDARREGYRCIDLPGDLSLWVRGDRRRG